MTTVRILERLIGFNTVSHESNLDLIEYARSLLAEAGTRVDLVHDGTGRKANLYATVGPQDKSGVLLSGHTDVVPVEGQNWSVPPFEATCRPGCVYGRGAADMKGFVACALRAMVAASERTLRTPLHLALSHDEEIGCVGVRSLIAALEDAPFRPAMCIVGEPTSMEVATGHKGKLNLVAECTGVEAHSAYAPKVVNAIHLASELVALIRRIQGDLINDREKHDHAYEIPHTTLHVGRINGGTALNIVPKSCRLDFEIRNLGRDDPEKALEEILEGADRITAVARSFHSSSGIRIKQAGSYPALDTDEDEPVVGIARELSGSSRLLKVSFGTEGGLFNAVLGIPTVVCGPGSMEQGHKPDEFVATDQLERCDALLDALICRLEAGIQR